LSAVPRSDFFAQMLVNSCTPWCLINYYNLNMFVMHEPQLKFCLNFTNFSWPLFGIVFTSNFSCRSVWCRPRPNIQVESLQWNASPFYAQYQLLIHSKLAAECISRLTSALGTMLRDRHETSWEGHALSLAGINARAGGWNFGSGFTTMVLGSITVTPITPGDTDVLSKLLMWHGELPATLVL